MCGILGIIGKKKKPFFERDIKLFTELLHCTQLRGADGTGAFFDGGREGVVYRKDAMSPADWIDTKLYDELYNFWGKHSSFVIAHARASTRGKSIYKNTHPFNIDHITGVHNGTLFQHKHLADVENDSEALYTHMAKKGLQETINEITGAYALVWHNKKENTLNLLRNYERPLAVIELVNYFIICSELEMGLFICKRNKEYVKDSYELEPNTLASINLDTFTWSWKKVLKEFKAFSYLPPKEEEKEVKDVLAIGNKKETASIINYKTRRYTLPNAVTYGDTIYAYPIDVTRDGRQIIVNAWTDCYGSNENVRVVCDNEKFAMEIISSGVFVGRISATGSNQKSSESWVYLRDIRFSLNTNDGEYRGYHIASLPNRCSCCNLFMTLLDLQKRDISYSKVDNKELFSVMCKQCEEDFLVGNAMGSC